MTQLSESEIRMIERSIVACPLPEIVDNERVWLVLRGKPYASGRIEYVIHTFRASMGYYWGNYFTVSFEIEAVTEFYRILSVKTINCKCGGK